MGVRELGSDAEYDREVLQSRGVLVIVDYYATWCGPCKAIAGPMDRLASTYSAARFVKVDVDRLQASAQRAQVRAMPTIHAYRDGRKLGEVVGADMAAIEALVRKHYTPASFSGAGQTLAGAGSSPAADVGSSKLVENLASLVAPVEECEVVFRLPNGESIKGRFKGTDTLAQVRDWVAANRTDAPGDRFTLMTTFPKRVYEGALLSRTLNEEGLTKRAQLLVAPY